MVLVQKWPFFQLFFLGNMGQENVFYDILEPKNTLLGYKNEKFKKLKNCHFSMLLVQKWPFFELFFLSSIGQKNVFYDNLEPKTPSQAIKTKSLKRLKIDSFPKGLTHGFSPKMAIFPTFFLGNIGQKNAFYDILETKKTFLGYKNTKFKKSKN